MDNEKLLRALSIVGYVNIFRGKWELVRKLVDLVPSIELICEVSFTNLDFTSLETWSALEENITLSFFVVDGKLRCRASKYFSGWYSQTRWIDFTVVLCLPDDFIQEISGSIEAQLISYADNAYEDFLENKRRHWRSEFIKTILNS